MEAGVGTSSRALCAPSCSSSRGSSQESKVSLRLCGAQPSARLRLWPQLFFPPLLSSASTLSARALEGASSSTEAGISESAAVQSAAGIAASPSIQDSVESATNSSSAERVGDAASQAVQSSAEKLGDAASSPSIDSATGNSDMLVNILGATAFLALVLLTIGVVYLFVTDLLEKRKRDEEMKRLNEEEATGKKKQGRAGSMMATSKGGAKGFGRKQPMDNDDE